MGRDPAEEHADNKECVVNRSLISLKDFEDAGQIVVPGKQIKLAEK
jgi:hypothetical protein